MAMVRGVDKARTIRKIAMQYEAILQVKSIIHCQIQN